MFDNLHFEDWFETGIQEQGYSLIKSICYPNPTRNQLTIEFENENNSIFEFELFDALGRKTIFISNITGQELSVDSGKLHSGLFYYRIINKSQNKFTVGTFIKN
ncbi:MAG: T9SS type A sorting domain-containing protein [Bacteroidales bacterium]|nr:T9SS type A sorting domain-containing protein [Bacteroidales bacterium]